MKLTLDDLSEKMYDGRCFCFYFTPVEISELGGANRIVMAKLSTDGEAVRVAGSIFATRLGDRYMHVRSER